MRHDQFFVTVRVYPEKLRIVKETSSSRYSQELAEVDRHPLLWQADDEGGDGCIAVWEFM